MTLDNLNVTGVEVSRDLLSLKIYYTDYISVGYVKLSESTESEENSDKNSDNNLKKKISEKGIK